jgi:CHAT domain-containing protein
VVLSACETGVGGQLGNGEEILGFGYPPFILIGNGL